MADRTPSQTVGPFFSEALRWRDGGTVAFSEPGTRVVVIGRVFDGAGAPVADALVETWQLSPAGATPTGASHGNPHGFARVETAKDGGFRIETALPGGSGAPHLEVAILARGLLKALHTRVYLAPIARVAAEPDLRSLAVSPRLASLVAAPTGDGTFRWDVRLQGEGETVFFTS